MYCHISHFDKHFKYTRETGIGGHLQVADVAVRSGFVSIQAEQNCPRIAATSVKLAICLPFRDA